MDSISLVACDIWTSLDNSSVDFTKLGGYDNDTTGGPSHINPFVWQAWSPSNRSVDPLAWMVCTVWESPNKVTHSYLELL